MKPNTKMKSYLTSIILVLLIFAVNDLHAFKNSNDNNIYTANIPDGIDIIDTVNNYKYAWGMEQNGPYDDEDEVQLIFIQIPEEDTTTIKFIETPAVVQPKAENQLFRKITQSTTETNIFPNPSNGDFSINISNSNTHYSIYIYSTAGKLVYRKNNCALSLQNISLTHLPKGIYIVRVKTTTEQFTNKIIIE